MDNLTLPCMLIVDDPQRTVRLYSLFITMNFTEVSDHIASRF